MARLAACLVILPPLAYGAGYFLWIAPSRMIYGANLAPSLGVASLLEPGALYVAVLLIAAAVSSVVGVRRLIAGRLDALIKRCPRWLPVCIESIPWIVLLGLLPVLSYRYTYGDPPGAVLDPAGGMAYLVLHVLVVAASFRRIYGLTRGALAPPETERRRHSPVARILNGALIGLLLFAQIQLAVIYGALGPNPAKRIRPVLVTEASSDLPSGSGSTRELLLIQSTAGQIMGFDAEAGIVVEIPRSRVAGLAFPRHSGRQRAFLDAVRKRTEVAAGEVETFFPVREPISEIEIDALLRGGEVRRTSTGRFVVG